MRVAGASIARLIAATLILYVVLIQPNHPDAIAWGALWVFPLELPTIILVLLAVGRHPAGRWIRAGITIILTAIIILKSADLISFNALSRGFNPVADLPLIDAFARLLTGTLGPVLTVLTALGGIIGIMLVAWLIWWALGVWSRVQLRPRGAGLAGVAASVAIVLVIAEVGQTMDGWTLPITPPGTAFTARIGVERAELIQSTLRELRTFREEVLNDPFTDTDGLFGAVDRDVLIIYVESYGRTSLDTPYYADMHRTTLEAYEERLGNLGLSMQSGILGSPTHGGQSWLAHSTIANGLWINDQVRYGAALASGRETLFHHAANNGLHTATVMPQITLDWPEADVMGFEDILPFDALGYEGLPFNWVTMPDQFTLTALDRLLRNGDDPRHLFAQIALISSHAPWVPVPEIIPWDTIGDGTVFNEIAASGDTPAVVWRDRERVRFQDRLAVDYALQAVMEYAVLHADDPPLMVVIGDHQAASFIGLDERREVPVHVIGPAHLVSALSGIAPSGGLLPEDDVEVIAMDAVRDILLRALSDTPIRMGDE